MKLSKDIDSKDLTYPLELEDKISIFIDRVKTWQLDIAEYLIENNPDSGFATLSIVLSYFEMIGKYLKGYEDRFCSEYHFQIGVKESILSSIKDSKDELIQAIFANFLLILYKGGRNGFYHVGMPDKKILLTGDMGDTFKYLNVTNPDEMAILINPRILVKHLKQHFSKYESDLRNEANVSLRRNFEKRFDYEQKGLELEFVDLIKIRNGEIKLKEKRC